MALGFWMNNKNCYGCKTCSIACKSEKQLTRASCSARYRAFAKIARQRFLPLDVMQPLRGPRMRKGVPLGTAKLDNGIVKQDHDKCIGCKMCIEACPYNAPCYDEEESKTYKCDMCYDRQQRGELPACVATCPGANIAVGEMEDLQKNHQADIVSDENSGTKPNFVITVDSKLNKEPDGSPWSNATSKLT